MLFRRTGRFPGLISSIFLVGIPAILAGCGVSVEGGRPEEDSIIADDAHLQDGRWIVLDWSAGSSAMLSGKAVPAVDLSQFEVADGTTLVEEPDFCVHVAERVQEIFNDLDPADVSVVTGDAEIYPQATRVLITQAVDENDPRRVGQAQYDPCDARSDDEAIVWGQAMINLGNGHTYDEWVHLFANTAAHEAAHTLGFNHPEVGGEADRLLPSDELMLASHSLESLLRPQSFLVAQESCPEDHLGLDSVVYQVPTGAASR